MKLGFCNQYPNILRWQHSHRQNMCDLSASRQERVPSFITFLYHAFSQVPSNYSQTQSIRVRPSHCNWKMWSPFRMVAPVELADEKQLNLNACLKCS